MAAIWVSRRLTPASSIVVTKVCLSMCGCILGIRIPAVAARRLSRRVAACRSIRPPRMLQDRSAGSFVDGAVECPAHGGR